MDLMIHVAVMLAALPICLHLGSAIGDSLADRGAERFERQPWFDQPSEE